MNRAWNVLPMGLCAVMTVSSAVQQNLVGAGVFGLMTLALLWWTIRPARATDKPIRPLRFGVGFASVVTLVAALEIAVGITAWGQDASGLAIVAASITVPVAGVLWWGAYRSWRRGYRWSTTITRAEMEKRAES